MKEAACRICARELCGNQRRWIFHPGAKLNLQVLLSHVVGRDLTRDGRGEFSCSKCTFMLERIYRFDTVVARVEVLSLERLQRLLLEKERLRQCIGGLYRRNNPEDGPGPGTGTGAGAELPSEDSPVLDLSVLRDVRYSDMVRDDLALSVYESWADKDDPVLDQHQHQCVVTPDLLWAQKPRRCRGCAALRVADSDYEAVCKVPRGIGRRSTSCGPPTRTDDPAGARMETDKPACEQRSPSPGSSVESLDPSVDVRSREVLEECPPGRDALWDGSLTDSSFSGLGVLLGLLRSWEYRPVKPRWGSKLPVLVKAKLVQGLSRRALDQDQDLDPDPPQMVVAAPELQSELDDMEEDWLDQYIRFPPGFQQVHGDQEPV